MEQERTRFALKKALHSLKNFECFLDGKSTPYKVVVISDKFRNADTAARLDRVQKLFKECPSDVYNAKNFAVECFTLSEWEKLPEAKKRNFIAPVAVPNHTHAGFKKAA